jgi:hypothetical protein
VTRKNGKNSDNLFNSSLQSLKRHFPKPMLSQGICKPYFHEKYILEIKDLTFNLNGIKVPKYK